MYNVVHAAAKTYNHNTAYIQDLISNIRINCMLYARRELKIVTSIYLSYDKSNIINANHFVKILTWWSNPKARINAMFLDIDNYDGESENMD